MRAAQGFMVILYFLLEPIHYREAGVEGKIALHPSSSEKPRKVKQSNKILTTT